MRPKNPNIYILCYQVNIVLNNVKDKQTDKLFIKKFLCYMANSVCVSMRPSADQPLA